MLGIQNNLMSLNATNNLTQSYNALSKSTNKLSSGLRINSAADDAAGLAVREQMRADVAVFNQGVRNANDGISLLQTMDGAAQVIDEKLIRMKELAEQAATGTYTDEQRDIMDNEFQAMIEEIDRIANGTEFNGINMLKSDATGLAQAVASGNDGGNLDISDDGTGASTTVFSQFTSGDVITIYGTDSDGNAFSAQVDDSLTDSEDVDALVTSINTALSGAGVDATAAWTQGTGLVITAGTAGESQLDVTLENHDASGSYAFSTENDGGQAGTAGQVAIHFGSNATEDVDYYYVDSHDMTASGLSVDTLDLQSVENARTALTTIANAIQEQTTARADFGANINRLESTVDNLTIQSENMQAAESQISDVDVASEMTNFTNTQIKSQAAVAMLAQANMLPQMAMSLLGG